ncbi:MAG: hypothetical protein KGL10_09420 [Alphaproteobacteria bacterium]|nr:hypothetical protein [Alphaproteobacteria bacterium]MDE2337518.1 hypothetical protein [Alphaproteobacteria bacterium]
MYERRNQPLITRAQWLRRLARSLRLSAAIVGVSLLSGILGYHFWGHLNWVDALLEASMILAGMGPVAPMRNDAVKIFASFYALFSGFVILAASSVALAPVLHRFLHRFHQEK